MAFPPSDLCLQIRQVLNSPGPGIGYHYNAEPPAFFANDEDIDQDPEGDVEFTSQSYVNSSRTASTSSGAPAQPNLDAMFKLPDNLRRFSSTWEACKQMALRQEKFLLVTIHDPQEFQSQYIFQT